MKDLTNPIDYLIQCCESIVNTGHCKITKFTIFNAKDELRRLQQKNQQLSQQLIQTTNLLHIEISKNLSYKNVAWGSINSKGDLYNLTLHYNKFQDENTLISLYSNEQEFQEKYGKLSKPTI